MRLINIYTHKLEQFFGDKIPPYAILSHCWEDEELSFEEWHEIETNNGNAVENIQRKKGYSKIVDACHFAKDLPEAQRRNRRLRHLWIDTVCIDKRSSAELSEAINSMFEWYKDSERCLVYMFDVNLTSSRRKITPGTWEASESDTLPVATRQQFKESKWFTRGWTLQELLAPLSTIYLSRTWETIGTEANREADVSDASNIPSFILKDRWMLKDVPVAEKMSWASRRTTTRSEDMAYCLMGLFGVNMPLLYGEGSKAFRRLQLEIIKDTHDHSIFLWKGPGRPSPLAPSPQAFQDVCSSYRSTWSLGRDPYYHNNLGLGVNLPLLSTIDSGVFLAVLDCKPIEAVLPVFTFYCLIVESTSKYSDKSQDEVNVLGHMVIDISVFGAEDPGSLKKTLYLDLSMHGLQDSYRMNEVAAAMGKPFMLSYSWYGNPCTITQVVFRQDADLYDLTTVGDGSDVLEEGLPVLKPEEASQISGIQLLLFKIYNRKRNKDLWFFVGHHRDHGWIVPWFSDSFPRREFRKEVIENLSLAVSCETFETGIHGYPAKTRVFSSPTNRGQPEQSTCAHITIDFGRVESDIEGQ